MKNKYLPTRLSKRNCLLIIILLSFLYLFENEGSYSFISNGNVGYMLKAMLWFGLALLIWKLPRMGQQGKLKFKESLNMWSLSFAIIFIMLSIGAGLLDGFGKSPYSHSASGILLNIFVAGAIVAGRESARSFLANSFDKGNNKIWLIFLTVFMTIINLPLGRLAQLNEFKDIVQYTAQYILPELSKNILSLYLVLLGGPIPSIIYSGVIEAFNWLSPVLPDLKWITTALLGSLCPVFCFMILQNIYASETKTLKAREIKKENPFSFMVTSVACIAIVWFAVGVFPVYPSAIATGSMEPSIMPGDMTLIDKRVIEHIKTGDIVQFKRDDMYISHRVIEVVETGSLKSYRTKGDNNSAADSELVKPEQITGKVIAVIPKIGWLTLIIKSDKSIDLKDIEF